MAHIDNSMATTYNNDNRWTTTMREKVKEWKEPEQV